MWVYSFGLGDLVFCSKLKEYLLCEIERNDFFFGFKVLNMGEVEIIFEDMLIILSWYIFGCKLLENIIKYNFVWMGVDVDWLFFMLYLGEE